VRGRLAIGPALRDAERRGLIEATADLHARVTFLPYAHGTAEIDGAFACLAAELPLIDETRDLDRRDGRPLARLVRSFPSSNSVAESAAAIVRLAGPSSSSSGGMESIYRGRLYRACGRVVADQAERGTSTLPARLALASPMLTAGRHDSRLGRNRWPSFGRNRWPSSTARLRIRRKYPINKGVESMRVIGRSAWGGQTPGLGGFAAPAGTLAQESR
jgi:hypothetical protein